MGQSGKAFSRCAKAAETRQAKLDDKSYKKDIPKLDVRDLHYSNVKLSRKETFNGGRPVAWLVEDLLDKKVSLSDPFLRLEVFETTSRKGNQTILRCINNRRLFALKEYAKKTGKRVMVNVDFFSRNTITEVKRFLKNSDATDGRDVRIRGRGTGWSRLM